MVLLGSPRVYLFVLYAMLIWFGVYTFRRRWVAWGILALSLPVAWLVVRLTQWLAGSQNTMLVMMAAVYELLILMVGVLIALQRREKPARFPCRQCSYDLTGNQSGVCPECGKTVDVSPPAAPPRLAGDPPVMHPSALVR